MTNLRVVGILTYLSGCWEKTGAVVAGRLILKVKQKNTRKLFM